MLVLSPLSVDRFGIFNVLYLCRQWVMSAPTSGFLQAISCNASSPFLDFTRCLTVILFRSEDLHLFLNGKGTGQWDREDLFQRHVGIQKARCHCKGEFVFDGKEATLELLDHNSEEPVQERKSITEFLPRLLNTVDVPHGSFTHPKSMSTALKWDRSRRSTRIRALIRKFIQIACRIVFLVHAKQLPNARDHQVVGQVFLALEVLHSVAQGPKDAL
mmetsp:Transcript_11339/g.32626  ORF Transcript_11339/g.32626 Transcript_11339/m.32626 type:complete len:216 (+) Transcript_11339:883-1530(+)